MDMIELNLKSIFIFACVVSIAVLASGCDSVDTDPPEDEPAPQPMASLRLVSYLDNSRAVRDVDGPGGCYASPGDVRMGPREGDLMVWASGEITLMVVFEGQEGALVDTLRFEGTDESYGRLRLLGTATGDTLAVAFDEADTPSRAVLVDLTSALSRGSRAAPCASFRFAADGAPFDTFDPNGEGPETYDVVELNDRYGRSSSVPGPHPLPWPYPDGDVNYSVRLVSGRLDLAGDGTYSSQKDIVEVRGHRGYQETERTISYQGTYIQGGPYYLFDPLEEPVLGVETPTGLYIRGAPQISVYFPDSESTALTLWTTKANLRLERRDGE